LFTATTNVLPGEFNPEFWTSTDDLIDSATEIGIELEINRYEELGHTRVLYDYPKEFSIKLVQFFSRHLN